MSSERSNSSTFMTEGAGAGGSRPTSAQQPNNDVRPPSSSASGRRHTNRESDNLEMMINNDKMGVGVRIPEGAVPPQQQQEGAALAAEASQSKALLPIPLNKKQLDVKCPLLESSVKYDELAGNYFRMVDEATMDAITIELPLSVHPDSALRQCGIILQRGIYKGKAVEFDPRLQKWFRIRDNEIMHDATAKKVGFLRDVIPGGVINVIGSVDLEKLNGDQSQDEQDKIEALAGQLQALQYTLKKRQEAQQQLAQFRAAKRGVVLEKKREGMTSLVDPSKTLRQRQQKLKDITSKTDDNGYSSIVGNEKPLDQITIDNDLTSIVDMADVDAKFLKKSDVVKFIKQYITRAIPSAAKTTSTLVVYTGSGDVSTLLAKGMAGITDKTTMERVQDRTHFFGSSTFLGINQQWDSDKLLRRGYSHHMILTPTTHDLKKQRDGTLSCRLCHVGKLTPDDAAMPCGQAHEMKQISEACRLVDNPKDRTHIAYKILSDAVVNFKQVLLETLTGGYQRQMRADNEPPSRMPIPIVTILIGGDLNVRHELQQSVKKNWPILVIEGSGGYADVLTSVIHKVNDVAPEAGIDEFRSYLTGIDPVTSEIINNSNCRVVKKGTKNEQLIRYIINAMRGDEILLKAWKMYALWHYNCSIWQFHHELYQVGTVMLSIAATAAAVVQTFMLLLWKEDSRPYPDEWVAPAVVRSETMYLYLFYTILQWTVIGLPIGLTLMHALSNRANAWQKWTALRLAAESSIREIYMYRTRTLGYSFEEVKRKKIEKERMQAEGVTPSSDQILYSSREDLLGIRLVAIQDELSTTEVASVTLREFTEGLPPPHIAKTGDPGFCDLTPDEYVKYRLATVRDYYTELSIEAGRMLSFLTYIIYIMGAAGTTLAALSAYGLGYLQAWVAFTTALVNSFQRFLDYSRISSMHELYNQTVSRLTDLEGWWSALGPEAESMKSRNHLVENTEDAIKDEIEGWAKQLQKGAEEMKKSQEAERKDREDLKTLREGKELTQIKEMRELGLDAFSPENLKNALLDPKGPMASKLKKQLVRLNEQVDGKIQSAKLDLTNSEYGRQAMSAVNSVLAKPIVQQAAMGVAAAGVIGYLGVTQGDKLLSGGLDGLEKKIEDVMNRADVQELLQKLKFSLPPDILKVVEHGYSRSRFLEFVHSEKINAKQMSIYMVMEVAARVNPTMVENIQAMNPREVLEFVKRNCLLDLTSSIMKAYEKDAIYPLVMTQSERFIGELKKVVNRPDIKSLQHTSIVQLMRDAEIRRVFVQMDPKQVANIVSNAQNILNVEVNPVACLAETTLQHIAEVDCDVLMTDAESRIRFLKSMGQLQTMPVNIDTMSREDLLNLFPSKFQEIFKEQSQIQLSYYVNRIMAGSPSSRIFGRLLFEESKRMGDLSARLKIFNDPEWCERFILAAESLNQIDINRWNKGDLIKALRINPHFDADMGDYVQDHIDEKDLSVILSSVQALFSNSYAGRMIDRLADEISTFDLRGMLNIEERDKLCSRILDLREFDVDKLEKSVIMKIMASEGLQQDLEVFSERQIKELVGTLSWIMYSPFSTRVATTAKKALEQILQSSCTPQVSADILKLLTQDVIDKLVTESAHMTSHDLSKLEKCKTVPEFLRFFGNTSISQAFVNVVRDQTKQEQYTKALLIVMGYLTKISGDVVLEEIIRRVSICTADRKVVTKIGLVLYGGETQTLLRASLPQLAKKLLLTKTIFELKELTMEELTRIDLTTNIVQGLQQELAPKDIVDFVVGFTSHFIVGAPYYLFQRTCDTIRNFDLRDMFPDTSGRYRLVILAIRMRHVLTSKLKAITEEVPMYDSERLGLEKSKLLKLMDDVDSPHFDIVRNQLRLCKPWQINKVFVVILMHLQDSTAKLGETLCEYLEKNPDNKVIEMLETIHLLRSQLEVYGKEFQDIFMDFDAQKFVKQQDRSSIVSKFVNDEDLQKFLTDFDEQQMKTVFGHLSLKCSGDAMKTVKQRFREVVEAKQADAQIGPESQLGFGEPEFDDEL